MYYNPGMGQKLSGLCTGPKSRDGAVSGGWKRLRAGSAGDLSDREFPSGNVSDVVCLQPPHSPAVSSVSMLANYDDDDRELDALTEESSWETVQLDDDDDNEGETSAYKYSSIKSQNGKRSGRKRKRYSNGQPPTSNATTSGQKAAARADDTFSKKGSTFRPGNLPAVITDSKPMRDADRLLAVLTEHARADAFSSEGPDSGDAVRRIIQHDIGRERTVNTRLRELKDIEGRKSERRLSVTTAATMSLHVIPEMIGEEPADPGEFKYSETNLYF